MPYLGAQKRAVAVEYTLAILKPDCVRKNLVGEVIRRMEAGGFRVRAMKMMRLSRKEAEAFYAVHAQRPFFGELTRFMSSGPCVPMVLEREDAVSAFRQLIGATDPKEALPGTIRRDLASSRGENIVHGSDSVENARKEVAYFFSDRSLVALSS